MRPGAGRVNEDMAVIFSSPARIHTLRDLRGGILSKTVREAYRRLMSLVEWNRG